MQNIMKHDTTPKVVLDIRGTLIQMYSRGTDPDSILDIDNTKINTAEFGLANWITEYLSHILETHAPRQVIAVWDGGNNYRKSFYPGYKAGRKEFSELKGKQITKLESLAKALLANLGAVQVQLANQEADDVIAFLCERIQEPISLYTNDKDLIQLASDKVLVLYRGAAIDKFVDEDGFEYPQTLVRIYKSICGDTSDDYPGVKGVGAVAFNKLVAAYGEDGMLELEQCVATGNFKPLEVAIAETGDKTLMKLYAQRYGDKSTGIVGWQTCYRLAALAPWICEKRFQGELPKLLWYKRLPNKENTLQILKSAGAEGFFQPHLARFFGEKTLITAANVQLLHRLLAADAFNQGPVTGFDLETYDALKHPQFQEAKKSGEYVDVLSQRITGAGFCYGDNLQHAVYIAVNHKDTANVPKEHVSEVLRTLRNPVVHGARFEIQVVKQDLGLHIESPVDTMPMVSQADENLDLGLKDNAITFLGYRQQTYKELMDACMESWVGEVPNDFDMTHVTGTQVLNYGTDDPICTAHLWSMLDLILSLEKTRDFTYNNYFSAAHPLVEAFEQGETVDLDELAKLAAEDAVTVDAARSRIRELLVEHCQVPNRTAANTLLAEDYDYLVAKWREKKELTKDDIDFRVRKEIDEYLEASVYHPWITTKKEPEFTPTVGKLDKVREVLGFANPILKSSKSYLADWVTTTPPASEAQQQFQQSLLLAVDSFKERTGDAYTEFCSLCKQWLLPTMPDVTSGDELNFGSPNQVTEILYLKLGLPVRRRGKVQPGSFRSMKRLEGSPATDEKAIRLAIADDTSPGDWRREVLENLLKAKAAITRDSYYYTPYPLWTHPADGRIHGGLQFPSTATRRPTASAPNFLQVTKKDGGKVRNCFKAHNQKSVVIAMDFSQQELRILANESRDPFLVDAYLASPALDVHSVTASMFCYNYLKLNRPDVLKKLGLNPGLVIYQTFMGFLKGEDSELSEIFKTMRTVAKTINFLIIYGGGPQAMAMQLSIPTDVAKVYFNEVLAKYTGFVAWREKVLDFGRTYGFVEMAYGSRYHIGNKLVAKDDGFRSRAERQTVNAVIQGGAAEILANALAEVHKRKILKETGAKSILPIYDEVKISCPVESAFEYITRMLEVMNVTPPGGIVPMVAEVDVAPLGKGWGSKIELGSNPTEDQVLAVIYGDSCKKEAA